MKIFVTGATGKVGSRLSKRLAERGDRVRALVRDAARAAALTEAGVELVEGDLLQPDSLAAAVRGVDAVVHCAAFLRGATPEQAHAVNDLGTRHLATAAQVASVKRFVFTSTGLVYGSTAGRLAREDDPCAPTAAYPVSKLEAERFLLALEGLDARVLRLPFVYGDGDAHIAEAVPMMRGFPKDQRMSDRPPRGRRAGRRAPARCRDASTSRLQRGRRRSARSRRTVRVRRSAAARRLRRRAGARVRRAARRSPHPRGARLPAEVSPPRGRDRSGRVIGSSSSARLRTRRRASR